MTTPKLLPPLNFLNNLFTFNFEEGLIYRKKCLDIYFFNGDIRKQTMHNNKINNLAFNSPHNNGYLCGPYNNINYLAHRILYYIYYNTQPLLIDHKDRCKINNKISNLRAVSQSSSNLNRCNKGRSITKQNNYIANIKKDGKTIYLGTFPTEQQALNIMKQYRIDNNYEQVQYLKAIS